jgi:hypothetical protein
MTATALKSPFPYYGGKSRVAGVIWQHFGEVANYVECFAGSLAVLLACPHPGHTETVNDADGLLSNFWRALRADPDAVAVHADFPVSELDLHARHAWLVRQRADVECLLADPDWYDAKIAGWWAWGISQWIGSGWCAASGKTPRKRPVVAGSGTRTHGGLGVHRKSFGQLPDVGSTASGGQDRGRGIHRVSLAPARIPDVGHLSMQMPHVGNAGRGLHRASEAHALRDYLRALGARLRRTRVVCGDFARVLGPSVTYRHGMTAVLLDPPYDQDERAAVYAVESDAAHRAWPDGWTVYRWKTAGGYGSQGNGRGRENASRECIWFSRHCVGVNDLPLFRGLL